LGRCRSTKKVNLLGWEKTEWGCQSQGKHPIFGIVPKLSQKRERSHAIKTEELDATEEKVTGGSLPASGSHPSAIDSLRRVSLNPKRTFRARRGGRCGA